MSDTYKAISLFSGAMGLDIGMERTGRFELLAAVELQPAFCDTIRKNRDAGHFKGDPIVYEGDIRDLDPERVLDDVQLEPGELDVLVGGPPCQSFSTAGRRGTVEDPRGTLLWEFLRFVEVLQPRIFVMENVRGLVSSALRHRPIADRPKRGGPPLEPEEQPGSVLTQWNADLRALSGGYRMDVFEVNSVNYGAPQIRERIIAIGNRLGRSDIDFPNPTHGPVDPAPDIEQPPLPGTPDDPRGDLQPWRTLRDALAGLSDPDPVVLDFSPRKKSFLELVPEGSNWRSLPEEVAEESMGRAYHAKGGRSGWWRRLTWDLPSPTLITMPNHASTSLCHPTETRALTLREYARIQEFPDEWEVCGTTAEQYAQVGNAVPTRLGEVAGRVVASSLDDEVLNRVDERDPAAAGRLIYIQSHVRARSWFKRGEAAVWGSDGQSRSAVYRAPKTLRRVRPIQQPD